MQPDSLARAALVLMLGMASPASAQCPDPSGFASAPPVLLGTYDPVALLVNGSDETSACLVAGPDTPCAPHHVYLPSGTRKQPPTVVFLPGSGMEPDKHDLVLQTAAYAGYRAIGLAYDNRGSVGSLCGTPACGAQCAENVHLERVTGQDTSPVTVTAAGDAILSRLYALLVALHMQDVADGTNDENWDSLFVPAAPAATMLDMAAIRWDRILVMGFSQGAGHAAYIAKTWQVGGVMILDTGSDSCDEGGGTLRAADWVLDPTNASGDRPHFGAGHARGSAPPLAVQSYWPQLGFGAVPGENLDVPPAAIPPQTSAYTDQAPVADPDCTEHSSMAKDGCMPTSSTSALAATSPDAAHLFEPYLLRLCEACVAPGCTLRARRLPALPERGVFVLLLAMAAAGGARLHRARRMSHGR